MALSEADFKKQWAASGEDQTPHFIETAWRRYQQIQSRTHPSSAESEDLTAENLRAAFEALKRSNPAISNAVDKYQILSHPASTIPWTATGIHLRSEQAVSTFARGRVWRSRLLDLYLNPQFALWFKIGINGKIFNSTGNSNTFTPSTSGELYVANQFPNQFAGPNGRVYDDLGGYFKADGHFNILIIVWKDGTIVTSLWRDHSGASTSSFDEGPKLVDMELSRLNHEQEWPIPKEWDYLWFLGKSNIYTSLSSTQQSKPCIRCKPHETVGIIQKTFSPAVGFGPQSTVSWTWCISALPSRLREDTTFTHDYLSLAFEFENGRDLTYTWSYELPKEYGYWCPLPTWTDREYHVVIRSGTERLGEMLDEKRDLYQDYVKYIEEGKEDKVKIPKQIVKVWLIAGNWFQKYDGEMTIQDLQIGEGENAVQVL